MATAAAKTVQVRLTYKVNKSGKVTFTPSVLHLKRGQVVEFVCDQGELNLILKPARAYNPAIFRTGGPPVVVKSSAKGTIWCGGTFRIVPPSGGKAQEVTIDPMRKEFGSVNDPPPGT